MPSEAGTVGMWDTVGATFMTCRFGQGLFKEMHRGTCQGFSGKCHITSVFYTISLERMCSRCLFV